MPDAASIETRLHEHVLSAGSPHSALLNKGILTNDWTDTYLQLLQEAGQKCGGQPCLPRKIVAAVHFALWYLNIRYDAWRGFSGGQRYEQTERNLGRLGTPSEFFLLSFTLTDEGRVT
jgi:hypothetical protein